jgi:hypothetical protein
LTQIDQWDDELLEHGGRAVKHVLKYKASARHELERITNHSVVIASYWELMHSCPFPDKELVAYLRKSYRDKGDLPEDDPPEPIETEVNHLLANGEGGQLHKINWYRVSMIILKKMC